jgi:hypothetical protein
MRSVRCGTARGSYGDPTRPRRGLPGRPAARSPDGGDFCGWEEQRAPCTGAGAEERRAAVCVVLWGSLTEALHLVFTLYSEFKASNADAFQPALDMA